MTEWEANVNRGFGVGIGIMAFIIIVDAVAVGMAASRPLNIGTFALGLTILFSLGLVGVIGYWVYSLINSEYKLDRNALMIRWGPTEQVIPTHEIKRVFTGNEIEERIQFRGGAWAGHWVGYGEIPGFGQTLFYATVPPKKQIFIATEGLVYGISPSEREDFLQSLQRRLQMGPTQIMEQSSKRPSILSWPIWRDWLGLVLWSSSILAILGLIGLLCFKFPSLPLLLPLHFDAAGRPDRLGARGQIFIIPLIGLLTLLLNGVLGSLLYQRERLASYLLWGGTFLIQVLVWTATIGILGHL